MAEEYKLENFTITDLKKIESKPNAARAWVLFIIETDHVKAPGKEFTYFGDVRAPETWPYQGVYVREMTYAIEERKGEKKNSVKRILYGDYGKAPKKDLPAAGSPAAGSEAPPPNPQLPELGKSIGVCTSYVMEIAKAMITVGFNGSQIDESLPMICDSVSRNSFIMYLDLKNRVAKEQEGNK